LSVAVVLALVWGAPAGAVIIASGDGTGNTSAPPDDPGWESVGKLHIYTGVYVGNGWVLTADHVGEQDVTFDGTTHRAVAGSGIQLTTYVNLQTYDADLLLFRIETDPHLSSPPVIAGSPPPYAGELIMIGQGRNRDPYQTWWDASWNEVLEGDPDVAYSGFKWSGGRALRWGTNKVLDRSQALMGPYGRVTWSFWTDFTEPGGTTGHEAHAAGGDSGGAVFATGSGELAGIMWTRSLYEGQPNATAVYGNATYAAQLADYRDQILSIVAEPACDNGVDDDGDGLIDAYDPGCDDLLDAFETSDALPCDDGFDNDDDGRVDFDPVTFEDPGDETTPPAGEGDPGCNDPTSSTESPQCQDGVHNDGDEMMDYDGGLSVLGYQATEADPQCVGKPWRNSEAPYPRPPYPCGLGAELALLLPPLLWMRRRQR
jgi:hypothetical protein